MRATQNNYVKVQQEEYAKLKKLQRNFEAFWNYVSHLRNIKDAREDVRRGRTITQEKLFEKLGL